MNVLYNKKLPLRFWENIWLVCTDEFKSTKYTKYHRIIYILQQMFLRLVCIKQKTIRNMEISALSYSVNIRVLHCHSLYMHWIVI